MLGDLISLLRRKKLSDVSLKLPVMETSSREFDATQRRSVHSRGLNL